MEDGMTGDRSADAAARLADDLPSAEAPPKALPLRRKELLAQVATRTGAAHRDIKPLVDAILESLGDALEAERPLVLPPLGKASVKTRKGEGAQRILTLKLRRSPAKKREEPLADGAK